MYLLRCYFVKKGFFLLINCPKNKFDVLLNPLSSSKHSYVA